MHVLLKDLAKSYAYMKEAYARGGDELFPEQALFTMFDLARRMGRTADAANHKSALQKWLRSNASSLWARAFLADHPEFTGNSLP